MKPRLKIAEARTPDGQVLELRQHDQDFAILVNGDELMSSRRHEAELELARLACAAIAKQEAPTILIGGLGLGYTLRQTLDLVGPGAKVIISELSSTVVDWNRDYVGGLNDHPLMDERVELVIGDVAHLISSSTDRFDAIILDIDNGPNAVTARANDNLYGPRGIHACHDALKEHGCLAVWSAEPSKQYEHRLMKDGFQVRRYRAAPYPGCKTLSLFIWLASEDRRSLPPGGGEPLKGNKAKRKGSDRRPPNSGRRHRNDF
jgi:spermidine synthase